MTDTRAQQCRGGSSAGAMLLVLIISRGLERSTDAALVVAEHEGALDEVRHGRELVLAEPQWMRSITEVPPAMRDITAQVMTAISAITGPLEGAIPPRGHAWKRALAGKPRRPRPGFGRAGGRDASLPWRGQERQLDAGAPC